MSLMDIVCDEEQIAPPPPKSMSPTANEKNEPSSTAMVANICVKNEPGGEVEELVENFEDETENMPAMAMNSR